MRVPILVPMFRRLPMQRHLSHCPSCCCRRRAQSGHHVVHVWLGRVHAMHPVRKGSNDNMRVRTGDDHVLLYQWERWPPQSRTRNNVKPWTIIVSWMILFVRHWSHCHPLSWPCTVNWNTLSRAFPSRPYWDPTGWRTRHDKIDPTGSCLPAFPSLSVVDDDSPRQYGTITVMIASVPPGVRYARHDTRHRCVHRVWTIRWSHSWML